MTTEVDTLASSLKNFFNKGPIFNILPLKQANGMLNGSPQWDNTVARYSGTFADGTHIFFWQQSDGIGWETLTDTGQQHQKGTLQASAA